MKNNSGPITRSLVNAFAPVIVNKNIDNQSIQVGRFGAYECNGSLCIQVQIIIHKAIVQVTGFEPTHAAMVFDVVFNDCQWNAAHDAYEWQGGLYDIHYGRTTRNILWSDDHGQLLQVFSDEDNKAVTRKVLTELQASIKPKLIRSFLDSVLATTGKLCT